MPTCNLHNQTYKMDEYCVYCGAPPTVTTTNDIDYLKELQKDLKKFEENVNNQNEQNSYKYAYTHCLFCGQYGGHGNLTCPRLTENINMQLNKNFNY